MILTNKHIKVKIRSILNYANDIDNDNHLYLFNKINDLDCIFFK